MLQRFETEVRARIDEEEKTLILIEIGINDSLYVLAENKHGVSPEEYRQNLIKLVEISKRHQADLVFVGLTPVDDSRVDPIPWKPECSYRLKFVQKYEEILEKVCSERKIPFIELMNKFTDKDLNSLLTDGVHPNTESHQIIYEEVKKHLLEWKLI